MFPKSHLNDPAPTPGPQPESPNLQLLAAAAALTLGLDFCLWAPDLGGAAFAAAIALIAVFFYGSAVQKPRRLWLYLGLIAATAVQVLIELKPSSIAIAFVLLLVLVGDGHFAEVTTHLGKAIEVALAFAFPFPAWRRLGALFRPGAKLAQHGYQRLGLAWRVLQVVLPAVLLAGLFAVFFAEGNAVFGHMLGDAFASFWKWLSSIDFTFGRVVFWGAIFTLMLSLLRPLRTGIGGFIGAYTVPLWRRADEALGRWQSLVVLAVLNALFFFVNTIDAIYLWARAALPAGVTLSQFVHAGVYSLIGAVLLSALVLAVIFQQELARRSRALQWLATAWIVQNVCVLIGVALRLKLYVDDYQLSLLRLGVLLFLLLVFTGFVLLTVYLWQERRLGWLVRANLLATFALFFTVQFVDLDRMIADFNVNRWLADPKKVLDMDYIASLGHGAWPAEIRVARQRRDFSIEWLTNSAWHARAAVHTGTWRTWEGLKKRRAVELLRFYGERHPEPASR